MHGHMNVKYKRTVWAKFVVSVVWKVRLKVPKINADSDGETEVRFLIN